MDNYPTPAPSNRPRQMSLVRCQSCGRTEECSPTDVTAHMRAGGAVCCEHVMDLFVQVAWPGQTSGVVKAPPRRTLPADAPSEPPPTGEWNPPFEKSPRT